MPIKRPEIGARMERASPECGIRALDAEKGKYQLSFTSESPVKRWFGAEILDHDPAAVDLQRLRDIGVVLYNHDPDKVLGRVENPRVENGRCVCDVVFDTDADTAKIRAKIDSGTIKATSAGYRVTDWEAVATGEKSRDGRFAGPCEIARKWTPVEVSIVAVPADPSVGIGRSEETGGGTDMPEDIKRDLPPETPEKKDVAERREIDEAAIRAEGAENERKRVQEITALCRGIGVEPDGYIGDGKSTEETRAAVLEEMIKRQAALSVPAGDGVKRDETDKFRAAASDALTLRHTSHAPAREKELRDNAGDLAGFRLMRIVQRALEQDGIDTRHMGDAEMLERAFMLGDGSFGAIMDQTAGKVVREPYEQAATTYQAWARIGSLSDFKRKPTWRMGEMDGLPEVPMTGELTHGKFTEQTPFHRQLKSYGRTIGISRQMLINDDIGEFARLASGYANSAARQINRDAYAMLTGNPVLEIDSKQLFHASHANIAAGAALGTASIAQMRKLMRLQKGVDGKTVLNLNPAILMVPAELEVAARQFMVSVSDPASANAGVANVLRGTLEIIVDAELDAVSSTAYYIAAAANATDGVGVDFLNGQNQINVRRGEIMGQLGMAWDIFIDYGVYAGDWRGLVYNPGA